MWMLLAIALPMLAVGALCACRPKDRTGRQKFFAGSAWPSGGVALAEVVTPRGEGPWGVPDRGGT